MQKRVPSVMVVSCLLEAFAGLCYAVPPQGAETPCIEIPVLLCNQMPFLTASNPTWIPSNYTWTPNRLPAAFINLRPGLYCSTADGNYRGLQDWWYRFDDMPGYEGDGRAFTELIDRLNDAYDSGYRRIILNLPAGTVRLQDFSGSQWWGMPEWKRNAFTCVISDWLDDKPDTQFEIYSAFPINDPYSLCATSNIYDVPTDDVACGTDGEYRWYPCDGANAQYPPSGFVQSDVCNFHTNISPWQQLGITRVWLDHAYKYSAQFVEFPYCPLYAPPATGGPHFIGAEAFPMIFDPDPNLPPDVPTEIDPDRVVHCPAIMFTGHLFSEDGNKSWDVAASADATELVVVVDYTRVQYLDSDGDLDLDMFDVLKWTQRGFVLAAQSSENAFVPSSFTEYMKRVYDFGVLANRADFNGDGAVNTLDQTEFNATYAIYQGRSGCNWVHGDLNGDNYVGSQDQLLFNNWRFFHFNYPNAPASRDLGPADPMDALTKP